MDLQQLTLYTHPTTQDRAVLVGLSNGGTYRIQDAGGDPCFNHVTGEAMDPAELNEHPALNQALGAVGEFYKYWLSGNEDPMRLLLRKDSPALHELYEDAVDHDGSGPAQAPLRSVYDVQDPTEARKAAESLRHFLETLLPYDDRPEAAVNRRGNANAAACLKSFRAGDAPETCFSVVEYDELWNEAQALGWDARAPLTAGESLRAWLRKYTGMRRPVLGPSGITPVGQARFLAGGGMDEAGLTPPALAAIVARATALGWQKPAQR